MTRSTRWLALALIISTATATVAGVMAIAGRGGLLCSLTMAAVLGCILRAGYAQDDEDDAEEAAQRARDAADLRELKEHLAGLDDARKKEWERWTTAK